MRTKKININEKVMEQIRRNKIIMRPKIYFVVGSFLTFIGFVISVITSVFLVNLTRFAIRGHGPMKELRLEILLSSFPWWAPIIAVLGTLIGIKLLKAYDFSYKKNFIFIAIGLVTAIIIAGILIDYSGLNEIWFQRGPMKRFYQQFNNNIKGIDTIIKNRKGRGFIPN